MCVVVAADHGEGLGEHELFDHGESLYRTEVRVPLVIVPPSRDRSRTVVDEPVSLRDVPATIADLVATDAESPFPGRSLARFWSGPRPHRALRPAALRCSPSWRNPIPVTRIKVVPPRGGDR